jgi:2-dehydropantoate 2-reductase
LRVPSIAVLGPGGVGGFLAAALARAGQRVAVIARPETAEVINSAGIAVQSVRLGDFRARPTAHAELSAPVDFLLVATKATTLEQALERIRQTPRLTVPLLNGLDHIAVLRARYGPERVAAGSIRIEANRPEPGRVTQTSPSVRVDLAADDPALHASLRELRDVLLGAEISAQIGPSEAQVMWAKLVRLAPLALTTSVTERPIGYIRSDPHWRSVLQAAIVEAVAVANADGARIDAALALAELDAAHPTLSSSMQRDLAAGRPPELDAIPGAVLRAAHRLGLECPTIEHLVAQIEQRAGALSG